MGPRALSLEDVCQCHLGKTLQAAPEAVNVAVGSSPSPAPPKPAEWPGSHTSAHECPGETMASGARLSGSPLGLAWPGWVAAGMLAP